MTLDDQLDALRPLTPGAVVTLAGYKSGSNQLTDFRAKGRTIPRARLEALAVRLEQLAAAAREIAAID
jgi:hypothetical protein